MMLIGIEPHMVVILVLAAALWMGLRARLALCQPTASRCPYVPGRTVYA